MSTTTRLTIFAVFTIMLAACSSSGRTPGGAGTGTAATGAACWADADCITGFCDRDRCASPQPDHSYGRSCVAGVAPAAAAEAAKLYVCGAYLCREARCRSCADDTECRTDLGAPRCVPLAGHPGRRCGAASPADPRDP